MGSTSHAISGFFPPDSKTAIAIDEAFMGFLCQVSEELPVCALKAGCHGLLLSLPCCLAFFAGVIPNIYIYIYISIAVHGFGCEKGPFEL